MKTAVLFTYCFAQTWAQQLGPPPELYAPPLPTGSVAKAASVTPAGYTVSVDVTAPEALQ